MSAAAQFRSLQDETVRLFAAGRGQEALARLDAARRAAPTDPVPPTVLGFCLSRMGRRDEARRALDAALAANPAFAPAWYHRGVLQQDGGDGGAAARDFERAVALDPAYVEPLAELADHAARRGDATATRGFAERVAALDPTEPVSRLALTTIDLAERDFASAERRARALLAGGRLTPLNRSIALGQYADALDGQGRQSEAFDAYIASNQARRALYAPQFQRPESHSALGHARRLEAYFAAARPEAWNRPAAAGADPGPARRHVFLVGFPRSGTTLLEQVLAGHPDVVALEEKGTLDDAIGAYFIDQAAVDRLAAAGESELAGFRQAYWRRVAGFGVDPAGRVFIDKMPLNTVLLPLIRRLFPDARVLFAIRDPRDVVLSCFRRRFGMNPAMYEMLTLEGAAHYYDAVMRLGGLYRTLLDLPLHEARYEQLVADFETETLKATAFLDLEFTPSMADVAATARRREVDTPSSTQVTRGLYREGVGQWRPYADRLATVEPILAPWIEAYSYPRN